MSNSHAHKTRAWTCVLTFVQVAWIDAQEKAFEDEEEFVRSWVRCGLVPGSDVDQVLAAMWTRSWVRCGPGPGSDVDLDACWSFASGHSEGVVGLSGRLARCHIDP